MTTEPTDPAPERVVWRSRLGVDEAREAATPPGVDLVAIPDATVRDAQGATVLVDGDPPEALLDLPTLRHVIVPFTGVRATLRERAAVRPHLTVHNSHAGAPFVAQHAFALLLALANRLPRYDGALRTGDWDGTWPGDLEDAPASVPLAGRTALLLGFGAIGRAMVPMLTGVGMRVEAVRRRAGAEHEDGVRTWGSQALHEALGRADAVVVTLPATPQTNGLLDGAAFDALAEGALLVNVGRGAVIDEAAAWDALEAGRLGGFATDVWWRYPDGAEARRATLPSTRPFHRRPDVLLSPHRAASVEGWRFAAVRDVLATVAAILDGSDPGRNRVDVGAGY